MKHKLKIEGGVGEGEEEGKLMEKMLRLSVLTVTFEDNVVFIGRSIIDLRDVKLAHTERVFKTDSYSDTEISGTFPLDSVHLDK